MPKERTNKAFAAAALLLPDIPLDALLSFLKDTRGAVSWSAKDLKDCLRLDAKQTQQILAILEMQGYVAKDGSDWLTTVAGETVANSKKPQFSSESVTQALDTLKERTEAVNRDKRSEFKVTKVVAFGDFLTGRAQVQAADVGVLLSRRDLISGNPDDLEAERQEFMNGLRRKSRLFTVQTYRPWMSRRSHRDLL
jgi:hypothetical protein